MDCFVCTEVDSFNSQNLLEWSLLLLLLSVIFCSCWSVLFIYMWIKVETQQSRVLVCIRVYIRTLPAYAYTFFRHSLESLYAYIMSAYCGKPRSSFHSVDNLFTLKLILRLKVILKVVWHHIYLITYKCIIKPK